MKNEIRFPIIGIGASACGLDPFEAILRELPAPLNAAVIFIQHLLPDSNNLLPEILRCKFPSRDISEIADRMPIESGKIYVNPSNGDVTIQDGLFRVIPLLQKGLHLPIDGFLTSLAENAQEKAITIILSGSGTDGVRRIPGSLGVFALRIELEGLLVQCVDVRRGLGLLRGFLRKRRAWTRKREMHRRNTRNPSRTNEAPHRCPPVSSGSS